MPIMYRLPTVTKARHPLDASNPAMVVHYFQRTPQRQFDADTHYNFQIIVVLRGVHEVVFSEFRAAIYSGQIWWASCWEPHACRTSRANTEMAVITLSPELLGSASPFRDVNWLAPFFTPPADRPQANTRAARQTVLTLTRAILDLTQRQPYGWRTLQWLKIHELLVFLTAGWRPRRAPGTQLYHTENVALLLPALQRIMNHPEAMSSLNEAAHVCGLSRCRFSVLFSKTMGASFKQYALKVRLAGASRLLCTTRLPVKVVAQQCGFKNLTHFYHVFSRHFHVPPARFRCQADKTGENRPGLLRSP